MTLKRLANSALIEDDPKNETWSLKDFRPGEFPEGSLHWELRRAPENATQNT